MRLGNAHGARAELLKLTSAAPEDADGWAELALADIALGLYAEAEAAYKRSAAIREEIYGPDYLLVALPLGEVNGASRGR